MPGSAGTILDCPMTSCRQASLSGCSNLCRTSLIGISESSQRYESAAAISHPLDSIVRLILIKGNFDFGTIYNNLISAFIEDGLIFSRFVADLERNKIYINLGIIIYDGIVIN